MSNKTIKRVSLIPNLKSFGPTKTESQAKEVGEFSIMLAFCYGGGGGAGGVPLKAFAPLKF